VYSGGAKALNGVSIRVRAGELRAILDPNWGERDNPNNPNEKSLNTDSSNKGATYVFDHGVERNGGRIRRVLGYVLQEFSLRTELAGYENTLMYTKIYGVPGNRVRSIIEEVLDFTKLRGAVNRLVRTYSGGHVLGPGKHRL